VTASDNLSSQLFHGSPHAIKTGDIITPKEHDVAYAANDPSYSDIYAVSHNYRDRQYALFGMNYTVEPVDAQEMHETTMGERSKWPDPSSAPKKVFKSKKGFRVTGLHEFVPYDRE